MNYEVVETMAAFNLPDEFLMGDHTNPGVPSRTLTYGDW